MREKYESLSLATLKDLAKARGLKGISTLRKPELIERMLEEDEKEKASAGSAESKNTEHRQEESAREESCAREENRVREPRTSYDTFQKERIIRNVQSTPARIRRRQPSLTAARKQMAFWKYFRMDMDLFAVPIICRVRMTFMYLRPRSGVLT